MTFHFNVYSTSLLFGFVQAWIYAVLLWVRGHREERLSDVLLGWVLVALAFDIWMYMLGFAGIALFWQQLEFFPRTLGFLLPPLVYFYLKTQFDATFRFRWRDVRHVLPFAINTIYHLLVFVQGPAYVQRWKITVHEHYLSDVEFGVGLGQQFIYLFWSFQLYQAYRIWTKSQFSDTEAISFRWFRNFLIALTISLFINLAVTLLDSWLNLSFWQDWWGNLTNVILIYYLSIQGYAQIQPTRQFRFRPGDPVPEPPLPVTEQVTLAGQASFKNQQTPAPSLPKLPVLLPDLAQRIAQLQTYMDAEKPYLDADLSLTDLARRLRVSPVQLSQVINTGLGKNFNDFVNEYRVDAFKRQVRDPANAHLSFLGIALDCGFNSKATFNRAFRKCTGQSPKEFVGMESENRDE